MSLGKRTGILERFRDDWEVSPAGSPAASTSKSLATEQAMGWHNVQQDTWPWQACLLPGLTEECLASRGHSLGILVERGD